MKTKEIFHLLEMIDREGVRDRVVPCLMGSPGIGKTHEIERYARSKGRKVVHIIASQILPSEVSGITMPDKELGGMTVYDHVRLSSLEDGDILFFDELLQGQQQVLSACLTLIQERRLMSDRPLPDVLIAAAANPLASPSQLPQAIRDRFLFIGMQFDFDDWRAYMRDELGIEIDRSLANEVSAPDVSVEGWNSPTPRTLYKLCSLIKGNSDDPAVEELMKDIGLSGRLTSSLIAAARGDAANDMAKFAEMITGIMDGVLMERGDTGGDNPVYREIERLSSGEKNDTTDLFKMLQGMDEWESVIKPMLENMKIR